MPDVAELDDFTEKDVFIRTHSGRNFHLYGDDPEEIDIEDIARALAHVNRFTGHTEFPYSVAQHSLLVLEICRHYLTAKRGALFHALMHDASEAYLADIASPFKPELSNYRELEGRVTKRINTKYGVRSKWHPEVKWCDWVAVFAEALVLQPNGGPQDWAGWHKYGVYAEDFIRKQDGLLGPVPPNIVRQLFLHHFRELAA